MSRPRGDWYRPRGANDGREEKPRHDVVRLAVVTIAICEEEQPESRKDELPEQIDDEAGSWQQAAGSSCLLLPAACCPRPAHYFVVFVQTGLTGLATRYAEFAPGLGLNFWTRPLSTSATYRLPSESTLMPCTPQRPPWKLPIAPHA